MNQFIPWNVLFIAIGNATGKLRNAIVLKGLTGILVCLFVTGSALGQANAPNASENAILGKTRTFLFTYAGAVKDLSAGQTVNLWLPVPGSTLEQDVEIVAKLLPTNGSFFQEKQYGNKSLFFQVKADSQGKVPFAVTYRVSRREVKSDVQANVTLKPRVTDDVSRFLEPDRLVPIKGKPLTLLKDTKLPANDQFAAARILYDVVDDHMKYSKEGKGWGNGDAVWACDSKFGNCTDFHSLFISMARGNKIPSKFEMGFGLPPERGSGAVGGYHCWAWFMPKGKGWVPVDISEANRFPKMKEYYFGNLTEDRVQFTTGRDIELEPRQKGPALNYFIYPYAEVDGQPYPQEKITRSFAFQDL
jgi:transglutaminase-like putative cysteine protease